MYDQQGKIIGLDFGTRRSGVAVSEEEQQIALPLKSLPTHQVIPFLKNYVIQYKVVGIVVGNPLLHNGNRGKMVEQVATFVERLKATFPELQIKLEDERFTSIMAQKMLLQGGYKRKIREAKERIDLISAVLILRSYLERTTKVQEGPLGGKHVQLLGQDEH